MSTAPLVPALWNGEWWFNERGTFAHAINQPATGTRIRALCGVFFTPHLQAASTEPDKEADPVGACMNCSRVVHKDPNRVRKHQRENYKKPPPVRRASPAPTGAKTQKHEASNQVAQSRWKRNMYSDLWHMLDINGHPRCQRVSRVSLLPETRTVAPHGGQCCQGCFDIYMQDLKKQGTQ